MFQKRHPRLTVIVAPLAVMVLLTVIAGFSSYQLSRTWETAASEVNNTLVRQLILNNIRLGLQQTRRELETGQVQKARQTWQTTRQQLMLASSSPGKLQIPDTLKAFLSEDENIANTSLVLVQPFFDVDIDATRETLKRFQLYTRSTSIAMALSMLLLGITLTVITARDLNKLIQRLEDSRDLNIKVQEDERERIAQELHDAVVQELVDLKREYSPEKVDRMVDTMRRICHDLKPKVLEDLGLSSALELLTDNLRTDLACQVSLNLDADPLKTLPKNYHLPLFRVVQEMFNNIKQHAAATQVTLIVSYEPSESSVLTVNLRDNGQGFDPAETSNHGMGLAGIRERVQKLGGNIKIESAPGQGCKTRILIPVSANKQL
ncbi:MAG: hypothetical protein KTR14_09490 [Vampirovibrio sp.]|nr:hypothetical protein [Vampirovibrio sp.]